MPLWRCGRFDLALGQRTLVMGIVNTTPDSFSADGVLGTAAIEHALQLVEAGADILDIGGESTRPGAAVVPADEELRRVLPLVEALSEKADVPLSVDTSKAAVARRVLAAGASIINDISAGTFDADMPEVLGNADCGVVLMHLRGTPQQMAANTKSESELAKFSDVIEEIQSFWREQVSAMCDAGVSPERMCLDAGFGFGKTTDENLEILRRGRDLKDFEWENTSFPILSATSRKSAIGKVLGDLPVSERIFGTAAATAIAIQNGADIIRVHDVKQMSQVARMTDAVTRTEQVLKPNKC